MSAVIYIEGGGNRNESLESLFRRSWKKFFESAGLRGRMPRVVRGGPRDQTFHRFATAIVNPDPEQIPLLLVDSEGPVQAGHSVWEHLQARDRNWNPPSGAGEDQAFLMVQLMETWFLADRIALKEYFGQQFRENMFKQWPRLEDVPKATVLDSLKKATTNCSSPYTKGKVSFELLEKIDPAHVEDACPHARALLDRLRTL